MIHDALQSIMPCVCPVCALCMPCVCPVCAVCMPCVCPVYAVCMPCVCPVYALCMPCVCPVFALCMPCLCPVCAMCMPFFCPVYSCTPDRDCSVLCAQQHGCVLSNMAVCSATWLCAQQHGCVLSNMAVCSASWLCAQLHGCVLSNMADPSVQCHLLCTRFLRVGQNRVCTPYVWYFPCQKHRTYTVYTYVCMVWVNPTHSRCLLFLVVKEDIVCSDRE